MQPAAKTTSAVREQNKGVVKQVLDAFNAGDPSKVDRLHSASLRDHSPVPATGKGGLPALKEQITGIHKAFKGAKFEVETLAADGDIVVLRWKMSGTHVAQMFDGAKANQKPVTVRGTETLRVKDGVIVEHHSTFDRASAATLGKASN
jgi:predicted ester cyclase